VIAVESKDEIRERLGRSTDRADAVISAFFASGALPGSVPIAPIPTDPVYAATRHDPAAAWEAWNAEQPDTTGTIWEDRDPYTPDASYYGYIDWGT
jgi:hypothetical protein